MNGDEARALALGLPEVAEKPHFDKSAFAVKGKSFASLTADGEQLAVFVGVDEAKALLSQDPTTFEPARFGKTRIVDDWIRVNLRTADPRQVGELLQDGWRRQAPKRILSVYDAR
jgi:hypothetical protein